MIGDVSSVVGCAILWIRINRSLYSALVAIFGNDIKELTDYYCDGLMKDTIFVNLQF